MGGGYRVEMGGSWGGIWRVLVVEIGVVLLFEEDSEVQRGGGAEVQVLAADGLVQSFQSGWNWAACIFRWLLELRYLIPVRGTVVLAYHHVELKDRVQGMTQIQACQNLNDKSSNKTSPFRKPVTFANIWVSFCFLFLLGGCTGLMLAFLNFIIFKNNPLT